MQILKRLTERCLRGGASCGLALALAGCLAAPAFGDLAAIREEFKQRQAEADQMLRQEKVARIAAYIAENPDAADREAAYLAWLNTALEGNMFAEARRAAVAYRAAYPEGERVDQALAMQFLSTIYDEEFDVDAALAEANAIITEWRADAGRDPFEALRMELAISDFLVKRGRIDEARSELATLAKQPLLQENPLLARQVADDRKYVNAIGRPFDDFTAKDTKGNDLSAGTYAGRVVLVDFWATWCMPCIDELPTLKALYDEYNNKGFEIIGISLDTNLQQLDAFVNKWELNWPQYAHPSGPRNPVASKYGVTRIPASFLIDREGKLYRRDLLGENLEDAVAALVAQPGEPAVR